MNVNEIMKKIKNTHVSIKVEKDELMDVFNHYKKLQVVYIDPDENIVFL